LAFARGFFPWLMCCAGLLSFCALFFLSNEIVDYLVIGVSLECGYLRNSKFCVMRRVVHWSVLSVNLSIFSRVKIAVAFKEDIGCYDTSYVAVVAKFMSCCCCWWWWYCYCERNLDPLLIHSCQ
jgi:hypothetical protein